MKWIITVSAFITIYGASHAVLAGYTLESSVIAGGGGSSTGGGYTNTATIGQPVVGGPATAGGYSNQSGFWNIRTGDTIPPTVSGFTLTTPFRSQTMPFNVPITQLDATDLHGVTGYYFGSTTTPPVDAWGAGWNDPAATTLALNIKGPQTYYVWAKDEAGNISTDIMPASTDTILQYLLNVTLAGSGTSIDATTGIPAAPGITACAGSCSAAVDEGATVTLTGNPDGVSELSAWSGDVTSTSNPVLFAMNSDKSVTGSFAKVVKPARIVYGKGFDSVLGAVQTLTGNAATIQIRDSYTSNLPEDLVFGSDVTVNLDGGRDANWDATAAASTLKGTMAISKGRVNIQGFRLKQP